MQRRTLLKTIAAGGALSLGLSTTTGAKQVDVEDLDGLQLVRDGDVVERIENPRDEDFRRLDEMAEPDDALLSLEPNCMTYCKTDCDVVCDGGDCQYSHTCGDTKYCCQLEEN